MSQYEVRVDPKALKFLRNLKEVDQKRIDAALMLLGENPIPPKALKLTNRDGYRIRVGTFRILYTFKKDILTIRVIDIAHRRDIYR